MWRPSIMIDTPNQGSRLIRVRLSRAGRCILADTVNLRELQPTSGFLRELNRRAWPAWAAVHSIISSNAGTDNDDVVNITSQDLAALERYALLPEAPRWVQTFERNGILHLRVHNEAATVSLFTGIISDIDRK